VGLVCLAKARLKQLIIVQVVDDEEETLKASMGLGEELGIVPQLVERNIGECREELLSGRVQLKMPLNKYLNISKIRKCKIRISLLDITTYLRKVLGGMLVFSRILFS